MSILFISNNNFSPGLSGGDRIFLELLRRWSSRQKTGLMGAAETKLLIKKYRVKKIIFYQTDSFNKKINPDALNIIRHQIRRTLKSIFYIIRHHRLLSSYSHIYSVSDFYPDLIPAIFLKLLHPRINLLCGFYLVVVHPRNPSSPYSQISQSFKNYLYYYGQKISLRLVNRFADIVLITSEPDRIHFPGKKIIVVKGGVDIHPAQRWLKKHTLAPPPKRPYLGCFIGRFHPQKGVLTLIDIWSLVTKKIPSAKLALIGDGQLKAAAIAKIAQQHLQKNVRFFGFLDGSSKEKVFRQSAIILHPATFDSGGMAAAEAMSWGLPGISFDLESLKSYYPQGMIKVPLNHLPEFADKIIQLYQNPKLYQSVSQSALKLTREFWDWDKRAADIYHQIFHG